MFFLLYHLGIRFFFFFFLNNPPPPETSPLPLPPPLPFFQPRRAPPTPLPFPTAGTMHQIGISQSGGILGGTGDFQRVDLEGRWYAPLGQLGGDRPGSSGLKFVMGFTTRSGFVFGAAPFFDQLFTMGGTQYGIPLRGYDEFSITPNGFDANASSGQASASAFGKAYLLMTGEIGLRLSQMLYLSTFFDAGNVWARAGQFDPTRLFRGAGIGEIGRASCRERV